ncbi:MAG: 6-phosphogluconolactonase [Sphingomonadaceae bacterium]
MRLSVYPDARQLAEAAAGHVARLAREALADRGRFTFALAGGSTPRPVYERLATPPYASEVDWARTELFFGDERCVPPWDAGSNYAMVRHALLARVPVQEANVHRMRGEDDPQAAARDYEALLRDALGVVPGDMAPAAALDLVLLGMGENGHTASLFPGTPALGETRRWVVAQYVEGLGAWRLTLTPALLNAARHVTFLVSGAGKARTLQRVLDGPRIPQELPAQIIQPAHGELRWMVDAAAAGYLSRRP